MSNDEVETRDYGAADASDEDFIGLPPPSHERLARLTWDEQIEVRPIINDIHQRTIRIETKVDELKRSLDGLTAMVARSPSGVTLVNMVETILHKVEKLD